MKSLYTSLLFLFSAGISQAQVAVTSNANSFITTSTSYFPVMGAAPIGGTKYIDLKEGSPYFEDGWSSSKIIMQDGNIYTGLSVRINLMDNKIHFKDSLGKEMVLAKPVKEALLQETNQGNVHFINGILLPNAKEGLYLLLVNDTLTLLKGFKKTFEEYTSYGSAKEYSIKTVENYLVFVKDKEYEVRKPADFITIFPNDKAAIENEIKNVKGKGSKDIQLQSIARFCNTLLKKK